MGKMFFILDPKNFNVLLLVSTKMFFSASFRETKLPGIEYRYDAYILIHIHINLKYLIDKFYYFVIFRKEIYEIKNGTDFMTLPSPLMFEHKKS